MVLRDNLHGEVVLQHCDALVGPDGPYQTLLDLVPRVVGMVQDAEFRVAALAMEVKLPLGILVEVHAPAHQVRDALRSIPYHLLHGLRVRDEVPRHHRVVDMLLEVVHLQVSHTGHTTLSLVRISFVDGGLADEGDLALAALSDLQGITHSGDARADDEEVEFANHDILCLRVIYTYRYL